VVWDDSHHAVETWLPNYHPFGRTDLTAANLRERHTRWTDHCRARHGNP
jgi:hypothetical protein